MFAPRVYSIKAGIPVIQFGVDENCWFKDIVLNFPVYPSENVVS